MKKKKKIEIHCILDLYSYSWVKFLMIQFENPRLSIPFRLKISLFLFYDDLCLFN